ncbi:MAG TPA: hypothetical protein VNP04_04715 [Alphaproteobacteria bacterium]|nr:hypothetical protein [Alphaproteobacteria bacterium]
MAKVEYDAQRKKRFKTVELRGAEREWAPPPPRFAEVELREQVQQAGGKWNPRRKVWELRYGQVVALKLEARIVEEKASNRRYQD